MTFCITKIRKNKFREIIDLLVFKMIKKKKLLQGSSKPILKTFRLKRYFLT